MAGGRPRPSADVSLNFLGADAPPVRSASRREGGLARSTILYRSWPAAARRSFDLARRISRRADRMRVVAGKSVFVRVDLGGGRIITRKVVTLICLATNRKQLKPTYLKR